MDIDDVVTAIRDLEENRDYLKGELSDAEGRIEQLEETVGDLEDSLAEAHEILDDRRKLIERIGEIQ